MAQTVSIVGSGLVFNNTYTANVSAQYQQCIVQAEQFLEKICTNNVTINVTFDAAYNLQNNALAENSASLISVNYSQLKSALASVAKSPESISAVNALPTIDPSNGAVWDIPDAYARMLGLNSSTPAVDDTVTLSLSYNWQYGQDVVNAVEHELSEGALGRLGGLGVAQTTVGTTYWSTMDLFRYSSQNVRDYNWNDTTYFSLNGSSIDQSLPFDSLSTGGDVADFNNLDVFGYGNPGETNVFSAVDYQVLAALGWNSNASGNWVQIDQGSPIAMTAGDYKGLGSAQLVVSEAGSGIFLYTPSTDTWTKIDGGAPTMMATGSFMGAGIDVAAYYSNVGTYIWDAGNWTKIDGGAVTSMASGSFEATGFSNGTVVATSTLVLSEKGAGTYLYNTDGWSKIDGGVYSFMSAGDFYGNTNGNSFYSDLAAYCPGEGTYIWGKSTGWKKIDGGQATAYAAGDFLVGNNGNNSQTDLAAYFPGAGTYIWTANTNNWIKIDSGAGVEGLASVDLNGNGQNELLAYFKNAGVYEWQDGVGWSKYDNASALPSSAQEALFATGNFQGGSVVDAAVGFPGQSGVWLDPPGGASSAMVHEQPISSPYQDGGSLGAGSAIDVPLLRQYMASSFATPSFVTSGDWHGGMLSSNSTMGPDSSASPVLAQGFEHLVG